MSSGKKFSDCMYCIHYKGPNTEVPCNTCEKEKPFADPSQFKSFTSLTANGTDEEYELIRNMLCKHYGKPMSEEDLKKYEKLEKSF